MNIALLEQLAAAGTPMALIAQVAAEMARAEAATDAIESRRAADRVRKAAERERVRGCHVTPRDIADSPPPSPVPLSSSPRPLTPNPLTPIPPTQTHRAKPSVSVKSRFHRLPDDWEPGPLPTNLAAEEPDWPPGWLASQADRFRAWAANAADADGKGRKIKWDQAFHNWLRDNRLKEPINVRSMGRNNRLPAGRSTVQSRFSPGVEGGIRALAILDAEERAASRY